MLEFLRRRLVLLLSTTLMLIGAGGAGLWYFWAAPPGTETVADSQQGDDEDDEAALLSVKAVHPRIGSAELVRSVTQPVYVQPFFKAELMARVAGPVKAVHKNIGDQVKQGETLIEIDVPDLEQDLVHKNAQVKLGEQEVLAARTAINAVRAAEKEAAAMVREKQTDVQRAQARFKYAQAVYRRIKQLADSRAIEARLVDEHIEKVEAAQAEYNSSQTAVETAKANLEEFAGKLASAELDVEVKKARVQVARAELARAQSLADYTRIKAPFDGIVVNRRIDPGAFVQNASSGQAHPLMTVLKSDWITLVMWVPERDAALVRTGAPVTVRLDALGRQEISARVSRLSHWLDPEKSRDMRVEVDLENKKGLLKVGMYGNMTVELQRFERAPLLPSSAVFVRGGRTCICEVRDGKAHLVPVRVQLEDGIRVKVARLEMRHVSTGKPDVETPIELTGDEVVIRSGQGEIREGEDLKVTVEEW